LRDSKLTLVSADAETLRSVEGYLTHFGARLSSTSRLSDIAVEAEAFGADAVVVFADDFAPEEVRAAVRALSVRVTVIVTTERIEYEALNDERGDVVLLPRPIWGWTLLEAVRSGVSNAPRHR
jgi:hypothetical protein